MKREILKALGEAGGGYVSGEALSRAVGKSRAAVWQWIEELRADGYVIEAAPRRGYRLVSRPDRLYPWEIQSRLKTRLIGSSIEYHARIDSTNDLAKSLAKQGAPEGLVVVAEEQTKGRGRRGRSWASPFGLGIWVSVLLRPATPPFEAPKTALLAALAVARAIEETAGIEARVKWPNDVLVGGKKVAGILVEMDAELDEVRSLVVGAGINVNVPVHELPEEVRALATSLLEATGRTVDRVALLSKFLFHLEAYYFQWLEAGFGPILTALRQKAAYLGQPVQIVEATRRWEGVAVDIAPDGALLVREGSGAVVPVYAGDVSLRGGR